MAHYKEKENTENLLSTESTNQMQQLLKFITQPLLATTTATAVVVAPDDGHEDARNMLSCI